MAAFYKSTDGGDHFTKITTGLPTELIGKANLAVTAAKPDRVYALIEAKPGGGLTVQRMPVKHGRSSTRKRHLIQRPFYYVALGRTRRTPMCSTQAQKGFFQVDRWR